MAIARSPQVARLIRLRKLALAMDLPMAFLSLLFVGVVIVDLASSPGTVYRRWADHLSLDLWAVFALEYVLRLLIAPNRLGFLRRRWFDLLLLAVPGFQILRFFRFFGALQSLRVLSTFRAGIALRRGARSLGRFTRQSRLNYVVAITGVVVLLCAALMLVLERDAPGSQIRTYGDALWWSAATATTIAGNLNPVTAGGRVLAVLLMIYSVVVFGYLVGQAVTFFNPSPAKPREPDKPQ